MTEIYLSIVSGFEAWNYDQIYLRHSDFSSLFRTTLHHGDFSLLFRFLPHQCLTSISRGYSPFYFTFSPSNFSLVCKGYCCGNAVVIRCKKGAFSDTIMVLKFCSLVSTSSNNILKRIVVHIVGYKNKFGTLRLISPCLF